MQSLAVRYSLLALAGGLSRLIFVRPTPINWDGVQFALALDRFYLHSHQPHPPGYILYVLLGRGLLPLIPDPSLALSILSVLFSAISLPLIYWLACRVLEDETMATCAALLWLASPLALYYGSVGLTYLPEAVLGMVIAGLAWRARGLSTVGIAVVLGLALGIAGGVRQTSLLGLMPLCVWALWGGSLRKWLAFVVAFFGTCAVWLMPLLMLSGGLEAYLHENALLAQAVSARTSIIDAGLEGLAHNLTFEALGLALGLGFGLIPLGLWVARVIRFTLSPMLRAFILWWTMPTLVFYAVSHIGQYGYLLVVLPPILLLSAACIRVWGGRLAYRSWDDGRRATDDRGRFEARKAVPGVVICAVLAIASAAYFILASGPVTASNIADNDAHARAMREAVSRMDATSTVLVTSVDWSNPFRLMGYILPGYHVYAYGPDEKKKSGWLYSAYGGRSTYALPHPTAESRLGLPPGTRNVVALDDETAEMMGGEKSLKAVSLADGSTLYMLDLGGSLIQALVIEEGKIRGDDGR
jgi:hypothetical protein